MQNWGAQSPQIHLQVSSCTEGSGNIAEDGVDIFQEPEDQEVCYDIVSLGKV